MIVWKDRSYFWQRPQEDGVPGTLVERTPCDLANPIPLGISQQVRARGPASCPLRPQRTGEGLHRWPEQAASACGSPEASATQGRCQTREPREDVIPRRTPWVQGPSSHRLDGRRIQRLLPEEPRSVEVRVAGWHGQARLHGQPG